MKAARQYYEQSILIQKQLAASSPSDDGLQQDLAACYERAAATAKDADALELCRGALKFARSWRPPTRKARRRSAICRTPTNGWPMPPRQTSRRSLRAKRLDSQGLGRRRPRELQGPA